jgi:phosphatidylinositol 4-kinase
MAQTVRGFLALREHSEAIVTLVSLMMDTDFPCFTDQTITNLRARLCCEKSEKDAATFMTYKVIDSCAAVSVFTTFLYDVFQNWSNGIDY